MGTENSQTYEFVINCSNVDDSTGEEKDIPMKCRAEASMSLTRPEALFAVMCEPVVRAIGNGEINYRNDSILKKYDLKIESSTEENVVTIDVRLKDDNGEIDDLVKPAKFSMNLDDYINLGNDLLIKVRLPHE